MGRVFGGGDLQGWLRVFGGGDLQGWLPGVFGGGRGLLVWLLRVFSRSWDLGLDRMAGILSTAFCNQQLFFLLDALCKVLQTNCDSLSQQAFHFLRNAKKKYILLSSEYKRKVKWKKV